MPSWWDNAVVYEVYPRSFQDSDGDGIGDLRGLESRLAYLRWLGVDAIWLAPIYRSPLADFGYDVSDHTRIAPEYGTVGDFDALIASAHGRGIRVLVDLVVSHTSIEHRWFREHPDRYVWADGPEPPNNWIASFGGPAWSRDPQGGRLYLHSFYREQPDLDWRNPALREEMAAAVRFWAERGVDGFRVDAVDRVLKDPELRDDPPAPTPFPLPVHPDQQDLDLIHSRDAPDIGLALAALREAAGELPLIGEVYLPAPRVRRYLDHLDAAFAFDLLHSRWDAAELRAAIERASELGAAAFVLSNHDFSRVASRWGARNARAAAVLLLTLGGTAFVYQGEELGTADGPGADPARDRWGRDGFRHPMRWTAEPGGGFSAGDPWLAVDPAAPDVASQREDPGSVLSLFRELIALRRRIEGGVEPLAAGPGIVCFARGAHAVAINAGDVAAALPAELAAAGAVLLSEPGALAGGVLAGNAAAVVERPNAAAAR